MMIGQETLPKVLHRHSSKRQELPPHQISMRSNKQQAQERITQQRSMPFELFLCQSTAIFLEAALFCHLMDSQSMSFGNSESSTRKSHGRSKAVRLKHTLCLQFALRH